TPPKNVKTVIAIVILFPPLLLMLRCDLSLCFYYSKRLHFYQYILICNIAYREVTKYHIFAPCPISSTFGKESACTNEALNAKDPQTIIIGGGITARGTKLLDEVKEEVQKYLHQEIYNTCEISLAQNRNHAGMIGSIYHLLHPYE
ncbi:ROK family protein, partial [Bacillus pseudomycoides]|uniref:ROK family protein n=2 Tax=Bacillus pseudomycoides TaxID=64104 RepID=UPI00211F03EA